MTYSECNTSVLVDMADGILVLSLNRSESRNALTPLLMQSLMLHVQQAAADDDVRVLHLMGEGPVFCAGADLQWMLKGMHQTVDENVADAMLFYELYHTLTHFPKPLVVSVQGGAFGGALGLLACADVVVADAQCRFAFPETQRGIVPAMVMPFVIGKLGASASRYLLSGEPFTASDAQTMGLVHRVVASNAADEARNEALRFLACAPDALISTKLLLRSFQPAVNLSRDEALRLAVVIAQARTSDNGKEGLTAFIEKRQPAFKTQIL